jgi:hypothetical protein
VKNQRTPDGLNARTTRGLSRRAVLKFGLGMAGSAALGATLAACVSDRDDDEAAAEPVSDDDDATIEAEVEADDEAAADAGDDSDDLRSEMSREEAEAEYERYVEEWLEEYEMFELPEFSPEMDEVEIQGMTYDVWPYENTWVGEVTDDLFIAFSIDESYSGGSGEISAYACDSGDTSVYLTGELESGEAELDDCIDKIELTLDGDEIRGTLTLEDAEPLSFVAHPSENDAGLYRAETVEMGDIEVTTRWVVLADGRQRGARKCRNPWTGDCMWCPVAK